VIIADMIFSTDRERVFLHQYRDGNVVEPMKSSLWKEPTAQLLESLYASAFAPCRPFPDVFSITPHVVQASRTFDNVKDELRAYFPLVGLTYSGRITGLYILLIYHQSYIPYLLTQQEFVLPHKPADLQFISFPVSETFSTNLLNLTPTVKMILF
jgi:hypothetical protein